MLSGFHPHDVPLPTLADTVLLRRKAEIVVLRSRLKLYVFQRRLPQIRDTRPCPNCFAMFVLSAGRDVSKFVDQGFPRVARAAVSN